MKTQYAIYSVKKFDIAGVVSDDSKILLPSPDP
jgi:hypothetical protein